MAEQVSAEVDRRRAIIEMAFDAYLEVDEHNAIIEWSPQAEDTFGGDRVAVIAHRMWQERFEGATDVLGKSVTLDGNSYTIVGVMPDGFRFAGLDADVWLPMAFEPWELENRGGHNYQAIGRLKPGVTLAAARAEMKGITERLSQQFVLSRGWSVTMLPLQEQLVRGSERPLYVLFGAVGFVLLIACSNVATRCSPEPRPGAGVRHPGSVGGGSIASSANWF
jgi:hypothetical protein